MTKKTMLERFEEKYKISSTGCWEWTSSYLPTKNGTRGYGTFWASKEYDGVAKPVLAHRISLYLYKNIRVSKQLDVLHKCNNPKCVNPDHLYQGTHQDNMDDKVRAGHAVTMCGEKNGNSKLTEGGVIAIRADNRPYSLIANDYGVTSTLVCYIKLRKIWRHVK